MTKSKSRQNYRKKSNYGSRSSSTRKHNSHNSFLPSPTILQEYEYATEGAANRIIEMAEIEQDKRHDWEDEYLKYYKKSFRVGQLFGFITVILTLMSFLNLIKSGYTSSGFFMLVIVFICLSLVNFLSLLSNKKPLWRPNSSEKKD